MARSKVVRRPGDNSAGFTLIEALLTVAILAIAVGMALPRIRAGYARDIAASTAAHKLAADMRRARLVAIHDCYRDPDNVNRLGIGIRLEPSDAERYASYVMVRLHNDERVGRPVTLDSSGEGRVECWGLTACQEVQFNPLGVAQSVTATGTPVAGDAQIVIRGPNDIFVVAVRQASGSVEVEKVDQVPTAG